MFKAAGRRSPTAGLTVNLGRAGSPETEPGTREVWAVASVPRRAGTLQKPSRLQKSGVSLAGVPWGPEAAASGQGRGGVAQEGLPPQGAGAAARLHQCCVHSAPHTVGARQIPATRALRALLSCRALS